jgi:hypothetical protein
MIPVRWWELSIGVIIAIYIYKIRLKPETNTKLLNRIKDFSFFAIFCSLFIDYKSEYFPFPVALIPVFSTAVFCLYSDKEEKCISNSFLNLRLLQWFGSISFSLYLLHWIIVVMLRYSYGEDYFIVKICAILISIIGASVIYKYVERPFNLYLRKSYILSFGFASIVLILLFTTLLFNNNNYFKTNWINLRNFVDVKVESNGEELICHGRGDMKALKNPLESCLKPLSLQGKNNTLFINGDSHAVQFYFIANHALKDSKYQVRYINMESEDDSYGFLRSNGKDVRNQPGVFEYLLKVSNKNDVVLFTFSDTRLSKDAKISEELLKAGSRIWDNYIKKLALKGIKVILVLDSPTFSRKPTSSCIIPYKFFDSVRFCSIKKKIAAKKRKRQEEFFLELSKNNRNVFLWDLFPYFCDDETCTMVKDGKILFLDHSHFKKETAHSLAVEFYNFFFNGLRR